VEHRYGMSGPQSFGFIGGKGAADGK